LGPVLDGVRARRRGADAARAFSARAVGVGRTGLPGGALGARQAAAVDVRLEQVLDRVRTVRRGQADVVPGLAVVAEAVRVGEAALADVALLGAAPAAVDVGLVAVLDAVRAGGEDAGDPGPALEHARA